MPPLPGFCHLSHFFWVLFGKIIGFRAIVLHVIKFPVRSFSIPHQFPRTLPHRPGPTILPPQYPGTRQGLSTENGCQTDSLTRNDGSAPILSWIRTLSHFEEGRHEVDDMAYLGGDRIGCDLSRPSNDHGSRDASLMQPGLETPKRCILGESPTRPASHVRVARSRLMLRKILGIDFSTAAIVGKKHHQGVLL